MSQNFVNNVRFGGIVRVFYVSEILGGAKDLEGEGVEEFSLAEDAVGRFEGETCSFVQIF